MKKLNFFKKTHIWLPMQYRTWLDVTMSHVIIRHITTSKYTHVHDSWQDEITHHCFCSDNATAPIQQIRGGLSSFICHSLSFVTLKHIKINYSIFNNLLLMLDGGLLRFIHFIEEVEAAADDGVAVAGPRNDDGSGMSRCRKWGPIHYPYTHSHAI